MTRQPDVFASIGATVRAMRARVDRSLVDAGLRLGQFQLLRLLWEQDGLTPRELADALDVEMPTVTRTVQRLLRDGFVRREAHPQDARSVRIYLTDRGRGSRERVSQILASETERALDGLSAHERAALIGMMERIAENVRHEETAPRASSAVE
ncbi:MAG TPA: MarR family transcriptional regulator [Candidatus Aquilonibacter sp.]|nr:MarR family transcriptional regulator [Candidatus Aquilonibacter sp.]